MKGFFDRLTVSVRRAAIDAALEDIKSAFLRDFLDSLPVGVSKKLTAEQQEQLAQTAWRCALAQIPSLKEWRDSL